MRTKRDIEIIKYVEQYKSITIEQCSKLFFTNNRYGYDQARKRLSKLKKEGFLKRYRKDPKSMSIYYIDKPLKIHDLKIRDVLIEFINNFSYVNPKIEFKRMYDDKEYVIDGVFNLDHKIPVCVEIDYTHYTSMEKVRDILYFFEEQKHRPYIFIIVKLTQCELEFHRIGDYSYLYVLPWNLEGISEIFNRINRDIDYFKAR